MAPPSPEPGAILSPAWLGGRIVSAKDGDADGEVSMAENITCLKAVMKTVRS